MVIKDPVFGLDHAQALNKAIAHSRMIVIPGMGHGLTNAIFYSPIVQGIHEIAKK